ncbi:MAG: ribonuclease J [Candidatus Yanofskybacteria bacterium CG10_big_fil_rev_8_21_14_0_10_46_23]|uniref:Ribonuclease J n=1 Tax=Candidatus Yanofskybacteria bacterium CG10_big_fil_rev_8_21_14_0_10_46_23 TaxID=1975098 RepID=A0A2H0R700_9BACT|nr:MAG: ribonuclease J [Candidatus Yanofskybacteria bacterium CG10_big_fil_rev_8_21_14_0_10_46_23]
MERKKENEPSGSRGRSANRRSRKGFMDRPKLATQRRLPPTNIHDGKVGTPQAANGKVDDTLKIIPLGGIGEIGKNMYALEYKNEILVIDAGIMFPEEDMPGIDFLIPNTSYLEERKDKIQALILTHGHMDHVGAVPYVQEKLGNPDIYTAELTRGITIKRHMEFPDKPALKFQLVKDGDVEKISQYFTVEFFQVNHSIPDDLGLYIQTPVGNVIFSSDFKFDDQPINEKPADIEKIKSFGERGVLALMIDSTGAEKPGHSMSEADIQDNMEQIFREAEGMLIVGTFSSMINRIQQLITLSEKYGRKVVFDGYSLKSNTEISKKLGYIKMQKGTEISVNQIDSYPRNQVTVIATGAQGEDRAVLMRIVNREHRHIQATKNDSVIFSSSVIPGNERSIQRLKDMLYRSGLKVYHYNMMDIHTGGHGNQEDLLKMITYTKPTFLFPVHGHYSMTVTLGKLANKELGLPEDRVIIADNGSIVHFLPDQWWFDKEVAPSDYVMVDGLGVGDVGNVVLRDRQVLAEDGMFVVIALINSKTGKLDKSPDIISRGFVYLKDNKDLLMEVRRKLKIMIEKKSATPVNDSYIKDLIRDEIGRLLFQKTARRPMVLPVVIEV